jgi:hypothetical protein
MQFYRSSLIKTALTTLAALAALGIYSSLDPTMPQEERTEQSVRVVDYRGFLKTAPSNVPIPLPNGCRFRLKSRSPDRATVDVYFGDDALGSAEIDLRKPFTYQDMMDMTAKLFARKTV